MKQFYTIIFALFSFCTYGQTNPVAQEKVTQQIDSTAKATRKSVLDSIAKENTPLAKIDTLIKKITKDWNVSLRKSFDGSSKDENKPATFMWNKDFENGAEYITADLGLKITEWDIQDNGKYLIYPKFEWHRDDTEQEDKRKNIISGGITFDVMPWSKGLVPYFTGSFDYKNDYIKELETMNYKFYLSAIGDSFGTPHRSHRVEKYPVFEYYVYTGVEYYKSIEESSLDCTAWASRLFIDWRPIPALYRYFQLTGDYTYRIVGSDDLYNKGNLQWLTLAANIYFNSEQNIGFGIEYSKGDDPLANFVDTDKIAFGVKIKL